MACGDRQRALDIYEWNIRLSSSLMRDIAHLEVALRNAYDNSMCEYWTGSTHWLIDPQSPALAPLWRTRRKKRVDVNARNRKTIQEATRRVGGSAAAPGSIIAELSFGFWRHCTDAAHEKALWVPYLHRAWPKRTNRAEIERSLTRINNTRNRASHHEPMFGDKPDHDALSTYADVIRISGLLIPELAEYIRETSTVPCTLKQRP